MDIIQQILFLSCNNVSPILSKVGNELFACNVKGMIDDNREPFFLECHRFSEGLVSQMERSSRMEGTERIRRDQCSLFVLWVVGRCCFIVSTTYRKAKEHWRLSLNRFDRNKSVAPRNSFCHILNLAKLASLTDEWQTVAPISFGGCSRKVERIESCQSSQTY
jgi:hypothetical protein